MTAREHNKLLSIFYFVMGGLQVVVGVGLALIYAGVGTALLTAGQRDEDQMVGGIMLAASVAVGIIVTAFGAFTLFSAYKVLKVHRIGRTLAIVISILSLFSFPIGTALGVYGLWFMFGDMGKALYADNGMSGTYTQPPPDSWR
jgi:hypothetical protein